MQAVNERRLIEPAAATAGEALERIKVGIDNSSRRCTDHATAAIATYLGPNLAIASDFG